MRVVCHHEYRECM